MVLGALTHVVWDSFTHAGRWGVELVPWLQTEHAGRPGYAWAQYASGVVGLLVLLVWGLHRLATTPPDDAASSSSSAQRWVSWLVVAVGALLGVLVALSRSGGTGEATLYLMVTFGGTGLVAGVVLACAVWWLRASPARPRGRPRVACPPWHAPSRPPPPSTWQGCSTSPDPGTTWC